LAPELATQATLVSGLMAAVTGNLPNVFAGLLVVARVGGVDGHHDDSVGGRIEAIIVLPSTLRADC